MAPRNRLLLVLAIIVAALGALTAGVFIAFNGPPGGAPAASSIGGPFRPRDRPSAT